jgi:hypothetical protein
MHQTPQPCQSCPWLKTSDDGSYFDPEALERTTVEYLKVESLHPCHSRKQTFCPGFLSFVHHRNGGIQSLKMGRLAIVMGLLDLDLIPQLETFESVDEMLEDHRERMEIDRVFNTLFDKDSE